jgi:hypothetical protein
MRKSIDRGDREALEVGLLSADCELKIAIIFNICIFIKQIAAHQGL